MSPGNPFILDLKGQKVKVARHKKTDAGFVVFYLL